MCERSEQEEAVQGPFGSGRSHTARTPPLKDVISSCALLLSRWSKRQMYAELKRSLDTQREGEVQDKVFKQAFSSYQLPFFFNKQAQTR